MPKTRRQRTRRARRNRPPTPWDLLFPFQEIHITLKQVTKPIKTQESYTLQLLMPFFPLPALLILFPQALLSAPLPLLTLLQKF
uniref:Protein 10 xI n=1 Tax=Human T-cell leukemia virus 2 TaxID=11909 RepID=Q80821_HTLV2|nr:protein 10 xI [Human T-lymphotropic virus 2]AAB21369.1 Rof-1 [Human T-cell leukemia virus type I]